MNDKIINIDELAEKISRLKSSGCKITHCHGCFDLMHPGHIKHFKAAKEMGDVLVVTITPDVYVDKGEGRPVFDQELRAESIASLECVDYVAINKWPTAEKTLRLLGPHFYVKGQEFEKLEDKTGKIQKEYKVLKEIGAQARFTHEPVFSSSKLIKEFFKKPLDVSEENKVFLRNFSKKYSYDEIVDKLNKLKKLNVLVVGDGIIDEYHYCETMGKSPKAQLIVNKYLEHEVFAGGAFAIANHVASLCNQVHLISILGKESSKEDFILDSLKPNINSKFFYREDSPTIVKKRYINQYQKQKIFEINYINDSAIDSKLESSIKKYITNQSKDYDLIMICDFGHGFITESIIEDFEKYPDKLAVNTQTNGANSGYNLITKYHKNRFICLDGPEARLATQEKYANIEQVGVKLLQKIDTDNLIITIGSEGSICFSINGDINKTPAFTSKIVDIIGAGDAYFAYTAPCFAQDMPADMVSFIGNAVGALAVQVVGNKKTVEKYELLEFINTILN